MARFFSDLRSLFGEDELYKILNVSMVSSIWDVKKAYYKCSVKLHPNFRANCAEETDRFRMNKKFQALGKVYAIMSDRAKRSLYNREGAVAIETHEDRIKDYCKPWLQVFGRLNFGDIDEFEANYRGTCEELADLKAGYTLYQGDVYQIIANTLSCGNDEDLLRHRGVLKVLIETNQLVRYEKFEEDNDILVGGIRKKVDRVKKVRLPSSARSSVHQVPSIRADESCSNSAFQPSKAPSSLIDKQVVLKRIKRVKKSANDENADGSSIQLSNNATNMDDAGLQSAMPSRDASVNRRKRCKVKTFPALSTQILTESGDGLKSLDVADSVTSKGSDDDNITLQSDLARDNELEVSDIESHQVAASSKDDSPASKATTKTVPASSVTTCSERSVAETESMDQENDFCVWQSAPPKRTSRNTKSECSNFDSSKLTVKANGKSNEASSPKTNSKRMVGSDGMSECDEILRGSAQKNNADTASIVSCTQNNIQSIARHVQVHVQVPVHVSKFNKRMQSSIGRTIDREDGNRHVNFLHTVSVQGDVSSAQNSNASAAASADVQNDVYKRRKIQRGDLKQPGECTSSLMSVKINKKVFEKSVRSTENAEGEPNMEELDVGRSKSKSSLTLSSVCTVGKIQPRSVRPTTKSSGVIKKTSWKAPTKVSVSTD